MWRCIEAVSRGRMCESVTRSRRSPNRRGTASCVNSRARHRRKFYETGRFFTTGGLAPGAAQAGMISRRAHINAGMPYIPQLAMLSLSEVTASFSHGSTRCSRLPARSIDSFARHRRDPNPASMRDSSSARPAFRASPRMEGGAQRRSRAPDQAFEAHPPRGSPARWPAWRSRASPAWTTCACARSRS